MSNVLNTCATIVNKTIQIGTGEPTVTKFRPHRASLEESMKEVVSCSNLKELTNIVYKILTETLAYPYLVKKEEDLAIIIKLKAYCYDERIKWDTYLVYIGGVGVLGFTDGPL